jgi:predicted glycosyltransferase involved in capsule biosynthesis
MLSIIVPWKNRNELPDALPNLVLSARQTGGELIVVNYSGDEVLLLKHLSKYTNEVKVISVNEEKYFNKAAAQNIGSFCAQHDILFFCDCDIICNSKDVISLTNQLNTNSNQFATVRNITETQVNSRQAKHITKFGYELLIETSDGRQLRIMDNEEDGKDGTRQAPGLLFVRKNDFISIQGYNSELKGWGWEDQDIISRLILGAGLTRIQQGSFGHISHDDDARMAYYPSFASRWESRDRMFRKALSNYDNNNFLGSYQTDIERLCIAQEPHLSFPNKCFIDQGETYATL